MPKITPHVCRHTYCSNMKKAGINPKTLQYLMGYSDIDVTLNTYTHLGLEDATDELKRMEELENTGKELEKNKDIIPAGIVFLIQQRTPNHLIGKVMAYMIYLCFIPTGVIVCAVGMSAMGFFKKMEKEQQEVSA